MVQIITEFDPRLTDAREPLPGTVDDGSLSRRSYAVRGRRILDRVRNFYDEFHLYPDGAFPPVSASGHRYTLAGNPDPPVILNGRAVSPSAVGGPAFITIDNGATPVGQEVWFINGTATTAPTFYCGPTSKNRFEDSMHINFAPASWRVSRTIGDLEAGGTFRYFAVGHYNVPLLQDGETLYYGAWAVDPATGIFRVVGSDGTLFSSQLAQPAIVAALGARALWEMAPGAANQGPQLTQIALRGSELLPFAPLPTTVNRLTRNQSSAATTCPWVNLADNASGWPQRVVDATVPTAPNGTAIEMKSAAGAAALRASLPTLTGFTVGRLYTIQVKFKPVTTARNFIIGADWYTDTEPPVLLEGNSFGSPPALETVGAWEVFYFVVPARATTLQLSVKVTGAAANEVHRFTEVSVTEGTSGYYQYPSA